MKKTISGKALIIIAAAIPVMLWAVLGSRDLNLDGLGRLAGIAGLSLLSINIILSARLKVFDQLFGGLDKMYRLHHNLGCITLILLLLHANFLIIAYATVTPEAAFNFLTSTSLPLIAGRLGLLLLTCAMIVILYFKVRYQWFILAQRVMGGVIFLGGYHAMLTPGSDIRTITPLFVYMVILGGIAASVYVYRSVFHKKFSTTYTYKITRVTHQKKVTKITMRPFGTQLRHYAGQYAFLSFKSKHVSSESHPYTISSGSSSKELEFNIKTLGDFTASLQKLQVGELVEVDGPYGQFVSTKIGGPRQTWIAGGIGITPFLSMARSISNKPQIDLYYCVTEPSHALFLEELKTIAKKHTNFQVFPVYTDDEGLLTAERIQREKGLAQKILLCGPPPMMKSLEGQLLGAGIKKHNIHYEEFSLS